mmetsp:Transcript_14756/g.22359  ORF Transcript_14756/g.22359 Transcript_14756/m.22359 type:complete len:160 (-) Transcript_14756:163-642(-)
MKIPFQKLKIALLFEFFSIIGAGAAIIDRAELSGSNTCLNNNRFSHGGGGGGVAVKKHLDRIVVGRNYQAPSDATILSKKPRMLVTTTNNAMSIEGNLFSDSAFEKRSNPLAERPDQQETNIYSSSNDVVVEMEDILSLFVNTFCFILFFYIFYRNIFC